MPGRLLIELTPQAIAQVRHWLLLLASDPTAPEWSPAESQDTPASLRAAARWLVDNGHGGVMDADVVGVLLASFSISFQAQLKADLAGRSVVRRAGLVSVSELERMLRERAPG
jgi:hypothetical protein